MNTGADNQVPAPSGQTCGHRGTDSSSSCTGMQFDGFDHCLTHLEPEQLEQALERLSPGADLVAPGTQINAELFARILRAVATENEPPEFGNVNLAQARFVGSASFTGVKFSGRAVFQEAQFSEGASFDGALFSRDASFEGAEFTSFTQFKRAQFSGEARFDRAQFGKSAWFEGAQFSGDACFGDVQFQSAKFEGAQFKKGALFDKAEFRKSAQFENAHFNTAAVFDNAQFAEYALFKDAKFDGSVNFGQAQFGTFVTFKGAQFTGSAQFTLAKFGVFVVFSGTHYGKDVNFDAAEFTGAAWFDATKFSGDASFEAAHFRSSAIFTGARFSGDANFHAKFESDWSGPLAANNLILGAAEFLRPVQLDVAAGVIMCTGTTWEAGVTMRLRHAKVNLEHATFNEPSFVTGADQPFDLPGSQEKLDESMIASGSQESRRSDDQWMPVLLSLRGVDAFNLSVTDVDLSQCRFAGARLLDQLRLEGHSIFDQPPQGVHAGWAWLPIWRWSRRQSLSEERIWRATTAKYSGWMNDRLKGSAEVHPERLAGLYRQLRKAQEDAKNEPGAADFYYGEMEMRRHARTTPAAERAIIWLYWLLSGYGLRALRSLEALVIVSMIATVTLIGWGLAESTPPQHLTGTVTSGPHKPARISAALGAISTGLPPASQRWTAQRTETAAQVTVESIVFRSTAQPLTVIGSWITIAIRILGPVLLALTLLAVRNRVKR